MGESDDAAFLVLHALKVKGFAGMDEVVDLTGVEPATVERDLAGAVRAGSVVHREQYVDGWALTPAGEVRHGRLMAGEREAHSPALGAVVMAAADELARLQPRFRRVCTDWQLRTTGGAQTPNDHGDPAYDAAVVSALGELDDEVQAVIAAVGGVLGRMTRYGPRLRQARTGVEAGDRDRLTRPLAGSYHDTWVELRRDLMVTSGSEG